jgi:AraC-like DNA-binding protein
VHLWQIAYDPKTHGHTHTVAPGFGHSLLAPLLTYTFQQLRVSVAAWEHGFEWMPIHLQANAAMFEVEHGVRDRQLYNERKLAVVRRQKRIVRGELSGFWDFFVPVVVKGKVVAVLVAGPVAAARPTSADLIERWRRLTGRQAHPADPEFAAYLSVTLSTLVLDSGGLVAFERLLDCLAALMAGVGDAAELTNRFEALRGELQQARFIEDAWEKVREAVDDRSQRTAFDESLKNYLRDLGLSGMPDHVLVGLTVSRLPDRDPVDEAIARDAFQRAATELARRAGDAIAGQVGDYGVVFLSAGKGSLPRRKQKLQDLADRAATVARQKFALALHFGLSPHVASVPLNQSYQAALGAAESALASGEKLVLAASDAARSPHLLRELRGEMAKVVEERSELLGPRFDRYLEAVAVQCVYRIEPARAHMQVGFERMAEGLLESGALQEKSFRFLLEVLDRAARGARTIGELFGVYRRAIQDLSEAVKKPVAARQDRSLRGALDYIQQHYSETLPLKKVARVAGFAANYFSKLFKERERMTFEHYLRNLRIERAKQLLADTDLDAKRVAELSGFRYAPYFSRVFRRVTGQSPGEYRRQFQARRKPQKPQRR